jgi:hypothetical protein
MEDGFVVGNAVLWWTQKTPSVLLRQKDGNIKLDRSYSGWAKLDAKRCSNCNVIIFEHH